MYSVKPGRGPSGVGAAMLVGVAIFGVFWTLGARSAGAPGFFVAFGVFFVLAAIGGAAVNLYNALSKRRFSSFDVVRSDAEPDPLDPEKPRGPRPPPHGETPGDAFCGRCGRALGEGDRFCTGCGNPVQREP